MEKLYTSAKTIPGADCGSDHELLIAIFRLKLKKVEKTTRLRYDLNQIPYDYTVEVRNRFKRLDLIECLMNYGQRWCDIVQGAVIKTIPEKKKCKGEKERYTHLNAEFQRIARRDKKAFLSDQCKEIEGNKRMEKTRDLFKKI